MTRGVGTGTVAVRDLAAVVLLAGRVGRNSLARGIGRSVLDLPVEADRTVLDVWAEQIECVLGWVEHPRLRVRIAVDRTCPLPRTRPAGSSSRLEFEVVRDASEYRGTAGVVRDLTRDLGDDDRILVLNATQIQVEPLADVFRALDGGGESVSLVPFDGSDLATAFLLRCGRFAQVPSVGFVDLKEQLIPSLRRRSPLAVTRRQPGSVLPVRTLEEYVGALRSLHLRREGSPAGEPDDPFAETWDRSFRIVEAGVAVGEGAVIQDAVVLAGGRVEEGAAVVRSVVCPGGVVRRRRCVVGEVVTQG